MSDPSKGQEQSWGPVIEPHTDDPRMFTANRVLITDGLVVMDYDRRVTTVDLGRSEITRQFWSGWFRTANGGLFDGSRLSTVDDNGRPVHLPREGHHHD